MDKTYSGAETNNSTEAPALKRIFDKCAEQVISDEQAWRVLAPIIKMIKAGKFEKPRPASFYVKMLITVAAAVTIAVTVIFMHQNSPYNALMNIAGTENTLANAGWSGYISLAHIEERGGGDIAFRLVSADNTEVFDAAVTEEVGVYTFRGIPDGNYRLMALLSPLTDALHSEQVGELVVKDGRAVLVFDGD